MGQRVLIGLAVMGLVIISGSAGSAAPLAPPVECWIENQTPSVPAGGWASYVVHADGGYGTYAVTFVYGDGTQESGTYSSNAIGFSHIFWSPGTYAQTAVVSGAGSTASCAPLCTGCGIMYVSQSTDVTYNGSYVARLDHTYTFQKN